MKRCSKCGQIKDSASFNRNRTEPDGLQRWCKECRKSQARIAYQRDRDKRLQKDAEYRENNRELLRLRSRDWSKKHPDRIRAHQKRYKTLHREEYELANKHYKDSHREEHKRANRSWYERNKKRFRNYRDKSLARKFGVEVIDSYSIFVRDNWICQYCGKPVNPDEKYPSLQSPSLDHIIPISKGGKHTQENLQLVHLDCNKRKFTKLSKKRG